MDNQLYTKHKTVLAFGSIQKKNSLTLFPNCWGLRTKSKCVNVCVLDQIKRPSITVHPHTIHIENWLRTNFTKYKVCLLWMRELVVCGWDPFKQLIKTIEMWNKVRDGRWRCAIGEYVFFSICALMFVWNNAWRKHGHIVFAWCGQKDNNQPDPECLFIRVYPRIIHSNVLPCWI